MRTAALVAPLAGFAACSTGDDSGTDTASLRVGLAAPVLRASNTGLGFQKLALTRETLITIGTDGRPAPRILESWDASPDRLTWRLKIRPGVRFHDGTPVTARVLAPHLSAQLKTPTSNTYSLGSVENVEAEGDMIVRVTLKEPYAFLIEDIAVVAAERTVDKTRYGTGPYVVAEESAERLLFKSVEDHYRGRPEVDRIEVTLYPDQRNAWSALMRDDIDMLYEVSRDSLDFVRSESSVTVSTFNRPFVYLLGLNHAHPHLRDGRVRRALDLAVDRPALVRAGLAGEGEPAVSHVWPRHWAHDAGTSGTYDPAGAIRLLEEAGLRLDRQPNRMPARLRLHCVVHQPFARIALGLQRQLAAVDVDLQLEVLPASKIIERLATGDFESFIFEMNSGRGFKYLYQFWHSSAPLLKHGYRGADDVLDRVRRASSDSEFRAAAAGLQQRFRDDPPAVFLAWGRTSRAVSRRFDIEETGDDVYHTISRWTPARRDRP